MCASLEIIGRGGQHKSRWGGAEGARGSGVTEDEKRDRRGKRKRNRRKEKWTSSYIA